MTTLYKYKGIDITLKNGDFVDNEKFIRFQKCNICGKIKEGSEMWNRKRSHMCQECKDAGHTFEDEKETFYKEFQAKGLTDEYIDILWRAKKKLKSNSEPAQVKPLNDVTQKDNLDLGFGLKANGKPRKRPYKPKSSEFILQQKRVGQIRSELKGKGLTLKELARKAWEIYHQRYPEA